MLDGGWGKFRKNCQLYSEHIGTYWGTNWGTTCYQVGGNIFYSLLGSFQKIPKNTLQNNNKKSTYIHWLQTRWPEWFSDTECNCASPPWSKASSAHLEASNRHIGFHYDCCIQNTKVQHLKINKKGLFSSRQTYMTSQTPLHNLNKKYNRHPLGNIDSLLFIVQNGGGFSFASWFETTLKWLQLTPFGPVTSNCQRFPLAPLVPFGGKTDNITLKYSHILLIALLCDICSQYCLNYVNVIIT